jgi:sugar/nucleoside kinase (ribokinase family)
MVNCVILGVIGIDYIRTSKDSIKKSFGGTATYAGFAASLFSKTGIIGIIGNDFPKEMLGRLNKKNIN